jgi:hypothetical protein
MDCPSLPTSLLAKPAAGSASAARRCKICVSSRWHAGESMGAKLPPTHRADRAWGSIACIFLGLREATSGVFSPGNATCVCLCMATLPVRSLEIIGEERTRVRLHVFCSRRGVSTDVDVCQSCQHFESQGPDGVTCESSAPWSAIATVGKSGLFIGAAPLIQAVSAGNILGRRTVAVRGLSRELLTDARLDGTPIVVVVDEHDRPVATIVRGEAREARSILESASAYEALEPMVHHHVRCVSLVDVSGRLVGLLTDLDVLRWVAELRRRAVQSMTEAE